jgi:putative ABC transport system permease protein
MHSFSFKFAFRSLARNKTYSLLNVLGLGLGLGVSLIIYLYLHSELTYDSHFPNHEEIYRLSCDFEINNQLESYAGAGYSMAPMLEEEFDFMEASTRLIHIDESVLFKRGELKLGEADVALADSNFFKVFELEFLEGNSDTALSKPRSIVITESFANKYFGKKKVIGEMISTNNYDYTVTGLIADLPSNTHHKFSALISSFHRSLNMEQKRSSLWRVEAHTFLRFNKSYEADLLISRFDQFYQKNMLNTGGQIGASYSIGLTPLDDIHFASSDLKIDRPHGSQGYIYAFAAIGILILLLASINYINMATVRSLKRVKEAGMQKVLGSGKREIMWQVFLESLILSLLALFVGMVMVELTLELTPLNEVIGKNLSLNFSEYESLWWFPLALALAIAFLSGWYPAIYLSRIPAMAAIKKGVVRGETGLGLRKVLVGFQFSISVAVVITAMLMYKQMEFVKSKDLGFNKEDIVIVPIRDSITSNRMPKIQKTLQKSSFILASSMSSSSSEKSLGRTLIRARKGEKSNYQIVMDYMVVALDYFNTMEIELVKGRSFNSEDKNRNDDPIIINETAANLLFENGYDLDSDIEIVGPGLEDFKGRIIGVAKDFNVHSLRQVVEPLILVYEEIGEGFLHVRVDSENLLAALNDIEETLASVRPDIPFQFSFLNKDLLELYEEEQRQSKLILFLTYLAIFISFIGLTGLASFTTNLRTREVGIRKVLGADLSQMVKLIFREMLLLIVVSVILAIPLAYFLINAWLSNFAYKANLDPLIFIFSALLAILLSYLIISYHSLKIAGTKPVNTLRYE